MPVASTPVNVAVLGGGKMGGALIAGLIAAGWDALDLSVAEADPDRRHVLESAYEGVRVVPSPAWAVADAHVVVVAVKPEHVSGVLEAASSALAEETLILSIAAGVTIAEIEKAVPGHPVVRAMPNTPALIGAGAAAIAGGQDAHEEHLEAAEQLLGAVGVVERVPEPLLDAVTGLSGSGPAYVFLVAEALVEAGVLNGLPRSVATHLAEQTLLGASRLLTESDEGPAALREAVTSPGGTTAAGLAVLESAGIRGLFLEAVTAATIRSRDMRS